MAQEALRYVLVDVFARAPFAGNQLAVVLDGDRLSPYQMQQIASEFNLAETTFPIARTAEDEAAGADYRVRIFTTTVEVPFAGHPTLGTAWVLARRGLLPPGERVQACAAGLIDVTVPAEADGPVELGALPRDRSGPVAADVAARCAVSIGLDPGDVAGDAVVGGCGLSWLHLPVRDEALARARPRFAPMDDVDPGGLLDPLIGINAFSVTGGGDVGAAALAVHSRVFVPGVAVPEDPATGSAAVGLGVALVATGLAAADGTTRYDIRQGAEIGRPSQLSGRVEAADGVAARCWVAGQVQPIGEGVLTIPPQN